MQFTARISRTESIDKEPPPEMKGVAPIASKVTLIANVHDEANKAAWGGLLPSAGIEIGNLVGAAVDRFPLGKNVRVTLEVID
jgi:hypothetical protein